MRLRDCAIALCLWLVAPPSGHSDDVLSGPIPARVERVVDGDTVVVVASIWIGQTVTTHVRIAGVDTPELRGQCPRERDLAVAARDGLVALLAPPSVTLHNVRLGTYAGRVVAEIRDAQGRDVASTLLAQGLARTYGGRDPRPSWCPP